MSVAILKFLFFAISGGIAFRNFVDSNHSTTAAKIAAAIFIVFSVGFLIYEPDLIKPDIETEREYWKSVKDYSKKHPNDNKLFCKYLEKYQEGEFKDIALAECPLPVVAEAAAAPTEVAAAEPVVNPEPQEAVAVAPVAETKVLQIGDNYQGGIIFYLDDTGKHGLVAAPFDQTDSNDIQWCNGCSLNTNTGVTAVGATGTTIGTGQSNTAAIVKAQGAGSYAAKLCDDLVLGGYDDWFLPSIDELNLMYNTIGQGAKNDGGFVSGRYWSSSGSDREYAWNQLFYDGRQYDSSKSSTCYVRAVRAF